jgi:hypothetical protein
VRVSWRERWEHLKDGDRRAVNGLYATRERALTEMDIRWLRVTIAILVIGLALAIATGHPALTAGPGGVLAYQWWTLAPAQRASVLGRKPTDK